MKKYVLPLKYIGISVLTVGILLYLSLYLLLPFLLNSKDYSLLITDEVKKSTGLDLYIKDYRACVSPSLNLTFKAKKVELFYPNKVQVLDLKDANLDFSTAALMKKEFQIQKISGSKLQISTKLLKNGKFSIQDYLEKNYKENPNMKLKFSRKLPAAEFKEVLIKIKDEASGQKFKLYEKDFKISKNRINSDNIISAHGAFYCFDEKYFDYKLKLALNDTLKLKLRPFHISADNLQSHKPHGVIDVDVRLSGKNNNELSGHVNIDNFTFVVDKKRLPPSYFHIFLNKNTGILDSEFYAAKNEKAVINSRFNINPLNKIYLKCTTKMVHIANLKPIFTAMADIFCIPNKLDEFSVTGYAVADFELETDLKKIKSSGYLKIADSKIKHKSLPFNISDIKADVDFNNNNIIINSSKMFVNSQPVSVKGKIDNNAFCDLVLTADRLNLANIMNAFDFLRPAKDLKILSGIFSMKASLKGKPNGIRPDIDVTISQFSARHEKTSSVFSVNEIKSWIKNASPDKFDGTIKIQGVCYKNKAFPGAVRAEIVEAKINQNAINILPAKIVYDKASATLTGTLKNYTKSLDASIRLFGTLDTRVLKSFIPDSIKIYNKGILPLGMQISIKDKVVFIQCNVLASDSAYFSPFMIKNLGNSVFHINLKIADNIIRFEDTGLYSPPKSIKLSDKLDTSSLKKIMSISGYISENSSLRLIIHEPLKVSYNLLESALVRGNIYLNKKIVSPEIQGALVLSDIYMPKVYIKNLDLKFDKKMFKIDLADAKLGRTLLSLRADANSDFGKTKLINNIFISSDYLDIDDLINFSSLLPQAKYAPGIQSLCDIEKGKLSVKSIKLNRIIASNVSSDMRIKNNILYLDNLLANAYGGNTAAKITYNLPYASASAKIQARELDASMAASAFLPVGGQVSGKLNFDSTVTMSGTTEAQQMKTMRGNADVLITNALLGPLGQFEHFLHAQNLLSQRVIYASLNSAKRAIVPKNTGYVNYLKGKLKFNNGYIYISPVLTSGPQMSMYVSGNVNMLTDIVDLEVLGKVSPDVSDSIGPLGDLTLKNILDEHTKYADTIEKLFTSYNTELPEMDISKIPPLSSVANSESKNFRVLIEGDPQSIKAIKSFTWVNPPGTVHKLKKDTKEEEMPQANSSIKSDKPAENPVRNVETPVLKNNTNFLDSIPDNFN